MRLLPSTASVPPRLRSVPTAAPLPPRWRLYEAPDACTMSTPHSYPTHLRPMRSAWAVRENRRARLAAMPSAAIVDCERVQGTRDGEHLVRDPPPAPPCECRALSGRPGRA